MLVFCFEHFRCKTSKEFNRQIAARTTRCRQCKVVSDIKMDLKITADKLMFLLLIINSFTIKIDGMNIIQSSLFTVSHGHKTERHFSWNTTVESITLLQCAHLCFRKSDCLSFNFRDYAGEKTCFLYNVSAEAFLQDGYEDMHFSYVGSKRLWQAQVSNFYFCF